jgi:hypothetical protein
VPNQPKLVPLHVNSLSAAKLTELSKLNTDVLKKSLLPGQEGALRTRPDGTILNGHHRIHILKSRGAEVDGLPREVIPKTVTDFAVEERAKKKPL